MDSTPLQSRKVEKKKRCDDVIHGTTFTDLRLSDSLVTSCKKVGIVRPTKIQMRCIPEILKGRSVIGQSETGSGKTAAFILPILELLSVDPYGIFAVIITPARELALQISEQVRIFSSDIGGFRLQVCIGGQDMMMEACNLNRHPHVLIGTPGRVADHIRSASHVPTSRARFLVLDEADALMQPGFADDLSIITNSLPKKRQTLLFSATLNSTIRKLQQVSMTDAFVCETSECTDDSIFRMASTIHQCYTFLPPALKDCALFYVLDAYTSRSKQAIVFVPTCQIAQLITETLLELYKAEEEEEKRKRVVTLSSHLSQKRRTAALGTFRSRTAQVLICTDIASRGLDLPFVELVVNYNVPRTPETYVHRCGRTARAGRTGRAISLVTPNEIKLFLNIEEGIGEKIVALDVELNEYTSILKVVSNARRRAQLKLDEYAVKERKVKQRGTGRKRNRSSEL